MKRILIIRLSAIGDVIMSSALLPALRNTWPDAYIAWLVESESQPLLRSNPRLDEVIVWQRKHWKTLLKTRQIGELYKEMRGFVKTLRAHRFDLVLETQGLLKSGIWAWLSGATERIGLGSREGSQYLMTQVLSRASDDRRIGSEYLHLARTLGLNTGDFPMDIVVAPVDTEVAREHCQAIGITGPYAVFCPFTTRPQKHWFEDRWAQLSHELPERLKMKIAMLGGPSDQEAATRIAGVGPTALGNLVGHLTLSQSAAVIQGAKLLIGVDTGLTHLGIAYDVPTLALFGSTRPYLDPATPRAKVLYHPLLCSPCRRHPTCEGAFTCMKLHTVASVLEVAERLIAQQP